MKKNTLATVDFLPSENKKSDLLATAHALSFIPNLRSDFYALREVSR